MKTKLLISLLLVATLCFYGCEDKELDEPQDESVIVDPTNEETEEHKNGNKDDGNGSQGDENTPADDDEEEPDEVDPWFSEPGDGTKGSPYSVPQIMEMTDDEIYHINWCYVKGIVANINSAIYTPGEEGYTFNYYISEDGTGYVSYNDVGPCLFIFVGYALGGEKFATWDALKLRDEVIVYGGLGRGDFTGLSGSMLYYWNGEFAENQDDDGGDDNGDEDDEDEDDDNNDEDDDNGDEDGDDNDDGDDNGNEDEPEEDDPNDVCTYMNDDGFKQYCRDNFDLDGDRKVSFDEAEKVTVINCSTAEDFAGIEYFTNLQSFTSVSAKYLDLATNTKLSQIMLGGSTSSNGAPIEQLDLSQNENLISIGDYAFCRCTNLTSILVPETLVTLGAYAFYNCSSLGKITFSLRGNSLTPETTSYGSELAKISDYAFYGCESLTIIDIPWHVTEIGNYSFYGCTNLNNISGDSKTWPNYMTFLRGDLISLGKYAFSHCTSLPEIDMEKTQLTTIEENTFSSCSSMQYVAFPESLTSIGDSAFADCTSLNGLNSSSFVSIPENVVSIGNYAFRNCTKLWSVTLLSEDLAEIGNGAFYYCTRLKNVTLYAPDPPALGSMAFSDIDSNSYLYVPWKSATAYSRSDFAQYFSDISTF